MAVAARNPALRSLARAPAGVSSSGAASSSDVAVTIAAELEAAMCFADLNSVSATDQKSLVD